MIAAAAVVAAVAVPVIVCPCGKVGDRRDRGTPDGWAGSDHHRERDEDDDRQQRANTPADTDEGKEATCAGGENRDVAAGNRDDMVSASRLERVPRLVGNAGAIADQDGRSNGFRHRAVGTHPRRQGRSHVSADIRGQLVDRTRV